MEILIKEIQVQGLSIFVRKTAKLSLNRSIVDADKRVKTINDKPKIKYPEVVSEKPSFGYSLERKKTKADIVLRNCDVKYLLEKVFAHYLPTGTSDPFLPKLVSKEAKDSSLEIVCTACGKQYFLIDVQMVLEQGPLRCECGENLTGVGRKWLRSLRENQ